MLYKRVEPSGDLSSIIECYWIIENDDPTIHQQKILPDGFPELIFHYGKPYRINISGEWETQSLYLLAGQIRNHFFLENTGESGMLGVKLKPTAVSHLFGIRMDQVTDKVLDASEAIGSCIDKTGIQLLEASNYDQKIAIIEDFLRSLEPQEPLEELLTRALVLINKENGILPIAELHEKLNVSERKLERLFQRHIGLSPKFYSRIIRFNHVFSMVQEKQLSWSELALNTGYYDQSHFIKNFQEFTGEDPGKYFFENENMANFFLKKQE